MDTEQIAAKIEKTLKRFNEKDNVDPKDARIEIYMIESIKGSKEFDDITLNLFSGSKFIRYVDIQEDILQILFDPFHKVPIIKTFLLNFLVSYSIKKNYNPDESAIMIRKDMVKDGLNIQFVPKDGKINELTLDEIFADENLLK